jgi:flavorubredoxin
MIREFLAGDFEVHVLRVEMVKEYSNVLLHFNPRMIFDLVLNRKPRIRSLQNVGSYDFICVGTPNWYGRTAPPIITFVEDTANIEGMKVIAFVSSGLGKASCAEDLEKKLEKKGLRVLKTMNLILDEISESQLREIREIISPTN